MPSFITKDGFASAAVRIYYCDCKGAFLRQHSSLKEDELTTAYPKLRSSKAFRLDRVLNVALKAPCFIATSSCLGSATFLVSGKSKYWHCYQQVTNHGVSHPCIVYSTEGELLGRIVVEAGSIPISVLSWINSECLQCCGQSNKEANTALN